MAPMIRVTASILLVASFGFSVAYAKSPSEQEGWTAICKNVTGVHDGDTLTCVSDTYGTFVVRFAGLDAPETGQAHWRIARDRLKELAGRGTVADCYKQDQYGRRVCRLRSVGGKDLADAMIGEGLAWHATRFADEQT
ncbi:MAG: thermonuclease family protein [bacterium]|jgi:endonuclease YncB( thermonuclease family)|nr:thermonuclease family protein [Curvibacter sp.]